MEIIKTKDIKNLQFQDLYDFFYSLPSHGFRDFSKDIKTFENEFINLLEDPKYGFLFEYKNNKIVNYFLIKNEDSLKRSIIMTYDYNKIKDPYIRNKRIYPIKFSRDWYKKFTKKIC
ncbi:MAG: hypothetical protein ACJ0J5_06795 [Dehalococcoidia bacterium]